MFSICSRLLPARADCSAVLLTPGTGTCAASRKRISRPSVNSSLRRRSGILNALNAACITLFLLIIWPRLNDCAAGRLYFLTRGGRQLESDDGKWNRYVAVAENLDLRIAAVDESGTGQRLNINRRSRFEPRQFADVDRLV